jgi:hypothetical protein
VVGVSKQQTAYELPRTRFRGWSPPTYLIHDIVQRVGAVDGEANEDEIGFGVR